jgi:hypothetical protein
MRYPVSIHKETISGKGFQLSAKPFKFFDGYHSTIGFDIFRESHKEVVDV